MRNIRLTLVLIIGVALLFSCKKDKAGDPENIDYTVTITSPDNTKNYFTGTEQQIKWEDNFDENVTIELFKGTALVETIADSISNTGSYNWNIPENLSTGNDYKIKVSKTDYNSVYDESETFEISKSLPEIAFIYKESSTDATSFKKLLETRNATVELVEINDVATADFSAFSLIIIDSNTGYIYDWGTTEAVTNITNSGKLVLGLGFGGASFFENFGLSINWGHGWTNSDQNGTDIDNTSIYCVDTDLSIFTTPINITIPTTNLLQLYNNSGYIAEYQPSVGKGVILVGRQADNDTHYPLVSEDGHWLWGFTNSPESMTQEGKDLFINIIYKMLEL